MLPPQHWGEKQLIYGQEDHISLLTLSEIEIAYIDADVFKLTLKVTESMKLENEFRYAVKHPVVQCLNHTQRLQLMQNSRMMT